MMTAYKYDNGVQLQTANIIYGGSTENQFADTVGRTTWKRDALEKDIVYTIIKEIEQ